MALQKTINTSFGVSAKYWRQFRMNIIFGENAEIFLAGYPSQDTRNDGSQQIIDKIVLINEADFTDEIRSAMDVIRTAFYKKLKESKIETRETGETTEDGEPVTKEVETNEFADAVDC